MFRRARFAACLSVLLALCCLSGCVGVSASKDYHNEPTLGQQLVDLKKAHDTGAITDDEYAQLKSDLVSRSRSKKRR
jgi:hypothetical protein